MDQENQILVERRLLMERDGVEGRQNVVLQIGHPQWGKGGDEAVCPVAMKGLNADPIPVHGRDFFDVLVRAVRTLKLQCKSPPKGVRFFYPEGEPYEGEPVDIPDEYAEPSYRDDWSALVERRILVEEVGVEGRREVLIRIGQPYWLTEHEEAACPIEIEGLWDDFDRKPVHGSDLYGALTGAFDYLEDFFKGEWKRFRFYWPDGTPYRGDRPDYDPEPLRDPREVYGNWQVLAERTLLMEQAGHHGWKEIRLQIGYPFWFKEAKEARCPIAIRGLHEDLIAARCDDFFGALVMALIFFNAYLKGEAEHSRLFWPDGTPYAGEPLDRDPDTPDIG